MCGIAVIVGRAGPGTPAADIPTEAVERMTGALRHRGPDAQGIIHLPACSLGHRRLSVIDLATGDQPMADASGRYWVVFNGEIYNFRQLRSQLEQKGWQFRTQSDTEVLLYAYQEYGEQVPNHLIGQFAFAIWDLVEQRLFAARDRFGEKPFYWMISPQGHFLAASEIKALLASGLVQPSLDLAAVELYLGLIYVPPYRTIYQDVHVLPPGHWLSWHKGGCRQAAYWQPDLSTAGAVEMPEVVERLRALVEQAICRQMVADVPVGAFLSGGLDSSTIVALMSRLTSLPVQTFSVGFGDLIDELPYARQVAQGCRTDHHEIQMEIRVGELLEQMAAVYDEPLADSSNIPTYLMAEFASRSVKVVLAGDGGDELFGGYDWYLPLLEDRSMDASTAQWLLRRLQTGMLYRLARLGLPLGERAEAAYAVYRRLDDKRRFPDFWERHLAQTTEVMGHRASWWQNNLLFRPQAALQAVYAPPPRLSDMDRAVYFDLCCYLPGDILVKVDRASMAHGLETRAPFLDVDLVTYVLSLPAGLRFPQAPPQPLKPLLRLACADLWPAAVQKRGKQGFGAPVWSWVERPDVKSLVRRVVQPGSPLDAILPGVRGVYPSLHPQQVWNVLCLGLWLEKHPHCLKRLSLPS